jgi:hypothetical protein
VIPIDPSTLGPPPILVGDGPAAPYAQVLEDVTRTQAASVLSALVEAVVGVQACS